jgi:hypothetical protein
MHLHEPYACIHAIQLQMIATPTCNFKAQMRVHELSACIHAIKLQITTTHTCSVCIHELSACMHAVTSSKTYKCVYMSSVHAYMLLYRLKRTNAHT